LQGEVPRGMSRFIPQLKEMAKAGASGAEMMALLESKTKGAAAADVSPLIQFKNILGDVAENIGGGLMPSLTLVMDMFKAMPDAMQGIVAATPELVAAFATLGGPVTIALTAMAGAIGLVAKARKEYQDAFSAEDLITKQIKEAKTTEQAAIYLKMYSDALKNAKDNAKEFGKLPAALLSDASKAQIESIPKLEGYVAAAQAQMDKLRGGGVYA